MDFGAFVSILPGRDGLVHISQISEERVERVSDKLKEGDVVKVKVLEVDRQGRVRLSHDVSTVPPAAYQRVGAGKPMPGVFILPDRMPIGQALDEILFLSVDVEPDEWKDPVLFLPP